MQINIRLESSLDKLNRALASKPIYFLGSRVWCLQVTNASGYVAKIRINAKTEESAKESATAVVSGIKREGWLENVTDLYLYESHIFDAFTDHAKDFIPEIVRV